MAVTVEELEIVIQAKIQDALSGLETVQKKLMETATKVAPQFNKQMQAAMSGLASNLVQPIEKAQQQMRSATEKTSAASKQMTDETAKGFSDIHQKLSRLNAQILQEGKKLNGLMQTFNEGAGIVGKNHPSLEGIKKEIQDTEHLIGNLQAQMLNLQKTPVHVVDNSQQTEYMKQSTQAVQQSIERVQKIMESMKQTSANTMGLVAANLENVNQKIKVQQSLLDQLRNKLAQTMASEGMSEKTAHIQYRLLGAENAIRKLVDQYNKVSAAAQAAGEQMKKATAIVPASGEDLTITLAKLDAMKDAQAAKGLSEEYENLDKNTGKVKKSMDGKNKTLQRQTKDTGRESKAVKVMASAFASAKAKIDRAKKALSDFGDTLKKVLLAAGAYKAITAIGNFIKEGIKSAISAPEIENMFNVAFGSMAYEADQFARKLKDAFGLDVIASKQMLATFQNFQISMGIGSRTAAKMSKTLTQLAYDMASLYEMDSQQVFENLQSGLQGMPRALYKYGIAITEANVKQTALRYGLIQQGQEMTSQQKVIARYITILEQTKTSQGDLARTLQSPANQLRIFRSQMTAAGRAIGEAFLPFIQAIVPWLNAFAIVLQRLGTSFARFTYSLFGRDYDAEKKQAQEELKNLEDITNAEKDVGEEAEKTKKKIQNMLGPFDELYVIQQKTDKENENLETPNLEWDVPTLPEPEGENPYEKLADRIMDKLREIFKVFRQAWENEGQNTIDAAKYAFESLLEAIKAVGRSFSEVWNNGTGLEFVENILRIAQLIFNVIGDIASAFTIAWENAGTGTALIQQIFDSLNAVMELVLSIGKAFREAWNDGRGVEIWDAILSIATNVFAIVENLADRLRAAWEQNDNGVKIWGHILDIVQDVLDFLDRIAEATANWAAQLDFGPLVGSFENLLGVIERLVDSILNGLGWAYENVLLPFGTWLIQTAAPAFLDAVAAVLGSSVWQDAARSIKDLYENSLKPLAQWTGEKIMGFLNWVKENGDAAAKIIIAIGKGFLIWKSIKFANSIATDFLNMVKTIKNSGLVKVIDGIKNAFKKMSGSASAETGKVNASFKDMVNNASAALSGLAGTVTTKIKSIATAIATFAATNPFGAVAIAVGAVATAIGVTLYGEYKKTVDMMEERNMAKAFDGVPVSLDAVKASMEGIAQKYSELDQKVQEHKAAMQSLQSEYSTTISSIETNLDTLKNGTADVGTAMDNLSNGLMGLSSNIKSQVDADGTYFYNTWKGIFDNTEALTEEREAEILQDIVSSNETRKNEVDRIEGELQNLLAQWREAQIKGEQDKAAQIEQEVRRHYDELAKIAEQEQARQAEVDKQRQMLLAREILEGRQIVTKENYQELLAQIDQDERAARDSVINYQAEVRADLEGNHKAQMDLLEERKKKQEELGQSTADVQAEIDREIENYNDKLTALNANYTQSLQDIATQSVTTKTVLQEGLSGAAQDAKNVQDEFQGIQDKISGLNSYIEGQNRLFGTEFFDIDGISNAQTELETLQTKLQALVEANPEMFIKRWDGQFTFVATEAAEATKLIQDAIQTSIEDTARSATTEGGAISQNLFDGLKNGVNERLEEIRGTVGTVADAMITRFNEDFKIHSPSQVMYEKGLYIIQGLTKGITDNLSLASDAINKLAETIKTAMQQALSLGESSDNAFYQYGVEIVQGLAQGISENTQIITDTLNQTAEAINTAFKELFQIEDYSMVFYNYGMGFMQSLAQGVTEGIEIVREAFLAVGEAINTALNEALAVLGGGEMDEESSQGQDAGSGNGNAFYQFGTKLMMGLSQGITDTLPVVLETIAVISTSIIDAFKQAFLIDEFSQVFFDFGVLFMQSLADGIAEGMALVQEQMEALAELITQIYTDFIAEFSETLSNDMESINQIVSDQMDEMVNIVSQAVDEAAKEISSLISKINSAISKARELQSIASSVGGYSSGRNARRSVSYAADIPQFASGAVLRSPTVGLMAEYPGAASNPEIVTPQNILQETFIESMFPAVSALSTKLDVLIEAVRQGRVEIKGDAAEFLHIMKKVDEGNSLMTGQSIFASF